MDSDILHEDAKCKQVERSHKLQRSIFDQTVQNSNFHVFNIAWFLSHIWFQKSKVHFQLISTFLGNSDWGRSVLFPKSSPYLDPIFPSIVPISDHPLGSVPVLFWLPIIFIRTKQPTGFENGWFCRKKHVLRKLLKNRTSYQNWL